MTTLRAKKNPHSSTWGIYKRFSSLCPAVITSTLLSIVFFFCAHESLIRNTVCERPLTNWNLNENSNKWLLWLSFRDNKGRIAMFPGLILNYQCWSKCQTKPGWGFLNSWKELKISAFSLSPQAYFATS